MLNRHLIGQAGFVIVKCAPRVGEVEALQRGKAGEDIRGHPSQVLVERQIEKFEAAQRLKDSIIQRLQARVVEIQFF